MVGPERDRPVGRRRSRVAPLERHDLGDVEYGGVNAGFLILAVVFGLAGFLEARRFGREYGRTPWGWNPWVWGIVMFLSFLIGVILIAIAERQGRKAGPVTSPAGLPGAAAPGGGKWAPDPSGRFEYRWWDGQQWTAQVSRGGVTSEDPPV